MSAPILTFLMPNGNPYETQASFAYQRGERWIPHDENDIYVRRYSDHQV